MKKYLFLAVALLGLASCAKDDIANGNNPIHNGEIEESYIAINLSASDITRADGEDEDDPVFVDGEEAERAVSHADFFFFDEAGKPFNVNVSGTNDDQWTEGTGTGRNHLRVTAIEWSKDDKNSDDISDTAKPVMLLKTYKGEYPSQIVAVLNWSPAMDKSYSLEELHTAVAIQNTFKNAEEVDTNYFVMSNAVYAQNGNAVYATPLTIDNIKKSEDEAKTAPVTIYVERVAAKVQLNVNQDAKYEVKTGSVYAKILGWDLYRDNSQSMLLKDIVSTWNNDDIGFSWNDSPWYRSYWAVSLPAPTDDQIFGTPLSAGTSTYIGENTTGKATCTKAVIKAQLVNSANNPLEIAIWNNVEYVDEVENNESKGGLSLREAVANTLKFTYFAKSGDGNSTTYTGLRPEDLQCVAGGTANAPTGVAANEVYFQLSKAGEGKDWHKLENGVYKPVANDTANDAKSTKATNEALKSVPSAVLYKNGETFYYVDIKHLGAPGKAAEFGIVRNHVYNITISSIGGYGSPVYTGVSFLDYPQITDQNSFVSAKINILSWRLVSQTVDIQPNN